MAFLSTSRSETCPKPYLRAPRASLIDMLSLARQRRALKRLDNTALDDLGLTRLDAQKEARRPLWDVPSHWRR